MGKAKHDRILLARGGGGRLSDEMIREHILPNFKGETLENVQDAATLEAHAN